MIRAICIFLCLCVAASADDIDVTKALQWCRPGAKYDVAGETYAGIAWKDESQSKPTEQEVLAAWNEYVADRTARAAAAAARKVWTDAGAFWAEFTPTEKAAIVTSEVTGIKVLYAELTMWRGEVWSDDPAGGGRVIQGLDALIAAGILTEQRKTEILAKP